MSGAGEGAVWTVCIISLKEIVNENTQINSRMERTLERQAKLLQKGKHFGRKMGEKMRNAKYHNTFRYYMKEKWRGAFMDLILYSVVCCLIDKNTAKKMYDYLLKSHENTKNSWENYPQSNFTLIICHLDMYRFACKLTLPTLSADRAWFYCTGNSSELVTRRKRADDADDSTALSWDLRVGAL